MKELIASWWSDKLNLLYQEGLLSIILLNGVRF